MELKNHSLLALLPLLLAVALSEPAQAGRGRWTPFGPPNGEFRCFVADPVVAGTLYAVFETGNLYKSTDSGRSWAWASTGMAGFEVRALAADPTRSGTLWAASESAVYRTVDGAASWQRQSPAGFRFLPAGAAIPVVDSLIVFPGSAPALFLAVGDRLWRSTDGGAEWHVVLEEQGLLLLGAEPVRGVLYTGSLRPKGRLLRSTDRGQTWSPFARPPGGASLGLLAFTPADPNVLYGATSRGLFRSRDQGATWRAVRQLPPTSNNLLTTLAVDPEQPARLWIAYASSFTTPVVAESRDGGVTWVERRAGLEPGSIQGLGRQRGAPVVYAVGFNTLARLVDGRSRWMSSTASGFAIDDAGGWMRGRPSAPPTLYAGRGGRLFRSTDGGRRWEGFGVAGHTYDLALAPDDPDRLYLAAASGLHRSLDRGATWEVVNSNPAETVALSSGSHVIVGGCGIEQSADGGRTWLEAVACFDPSTSLVRQVRVLTVDPTTPGRIFGSMATYRLGPLNPLPQLIARELVRSQNHGETWTAVASNTAGLAFDPTQPGRIYTTRDGILLVSDTAGSTWSEVGPIRTDGTLRLVGDLLVDPASPAILYAASSTAGVLRSTDGGASWRPFNNGLDCAGSCLIFNLAVHPTVARRLVVATRASLLQIDLP